MTVPHTFTGWIQTLLEGMVAGNEPRHFLYSALILVGGFLVMEFLWRRIVGWMERIRQPGMMKRWRAYLSSFAPTVRLVAAVILIHGAQTPLDLPLEIGLLLGGLKSFLLALAIILFVFQLAQVLDVFYETVKSLRGSESELERDVSGDGESYPGGITKAKSLARITAIVGASLFFIYTQKGLFPDWIWESTWWNYGALLAVYAAIIAGGKILLEFLKALTLSLKDASDQVQLRLVIQATLWPVRLLLLAVALFLTGEMLSVPAPVAGLFDSMMSVSGALVIVVFLYKLLDVVEYEVTRFVKREDNELDMNFVQLVRIVLKVLVVVFGFIYLVKAATGQPMTSLLAGLGIGGLAVALAAQDTLKNFFGGIMIMMDKPFVVGDYIQVDGHHVIVEGIGLRSTKVRTFGGHLLFIPNERMAGITIENVKKRPFIRRNMNITITYDTPPQKVEKAVELIREILSGREELHPDQTTRVHFNEFNDTSLNIVVSYWFKENDHWSAIAFAEQINLEIMRAFEKDGIEFAFPTNTTYLAQDEKRPLRIAIRDDGAPVDGKSLAGEDGVAGEKP